MKNRDSQSSSPYNEAALEKSVECLIYASRWLLVPIFVGLIGLLILMTVKFYQEAFYITSHLMDVDKIDLTLKMLNLVDMALIASLLVMVAISGYENFVSRSDSELQSAAAKPSFFSNIDPGTIKVKLSLSIVAISSINLLQIFLSIEHFTETQIMWKAIIHLIFLGSALATAGVDIMQKKSKSI